MTTSLQQTSTSDITLLSHLRWVAALVVALSHIRQSILVDAAYHPAVNFVSTRNESFRKPLFAPQGYGHAAVIVFFVLSGFLVGEKLIKLYQSHDIDIQWPRFLIDRFCRIFVVLWPALVLTIVSLVTITLLAPKAPFVFAGQWTFDLAHPIIYDFNVRKWICAVSLTNELLSPTLQVNAPLWSLAYEWTFYVIGLALVLTFRSVHSIPACFVAFYGGILFVLAMIMQPDILISGLIWISGVLARIIYNNNIFYKKTSQVIGVVGVFFVLLLEKYHPQPDLILGLAVAFLISNIRWSTWNFGADIGRIFSNFSYSLYTTHFPIMLIVMAFGYRMGIIRSHLPENFFGFSVAIFAATVMVIIAWIFSRITEAKTILVRNWFVRKMNLLTLHN